jgi:hypothetical protein
MDQTNKPDKNKQIQVGQGRFSLTAQVLSAGGDLVVSVTGGDRPHLGAVAAATPRPSLENPMRTSATASVLCFVGHKEDEAAKYLSELLASALEVKVAVTAGMHWERITPEELALVGGLIKELGEKLVGFIKKERGPRIEVPRMD